jgi:hypothetical protein
MADDLGMPAAGGGGVDAIAFGVAADLVYNVFSATNSSPQTTELFAGDRAATLWKYVRLGGLQSAILIGIMAGRGRSLWPVIGGGLAGAFMWMMYSHALQAGQGQQPPAAANGG